MSEIGYVLKVLVITIALVLVLQYKVGNDSLERHAHVWIQQSWLSERVSEVTAGGWKLLRDGYKKASFTLGKTFDKESVPGERKLTEIKRSAEYVRDQAIKKGEEYIPEDEE